MIDLEFTKKWYGEKKHEQITWRGVPMVKCPMDLVIYQELIHKLRPSFILECGVKHGGTTLFLSEIAGPRTKVIGIDMVTSRIHPKVQKRTNIKILKGSSTDPAIVRRVHEMIGARPALVILDSDHHGPHVLTEMLMYSDLVRPGGYMIVEDTIVRHTRPDYDSNPADAVEDFMAGAGKDTWEVDTNCERLQVSYNPGGYLRRVR
jgi:cephalosporin hydroxylase